MSIKLKKLARQLNCSYSGNGDIMIMGVRDLLEEEPNYLSLCLSKDKKLPEYLNNKKNKNIILLSRYNMEGFHCILVSSKNMNEKFQKILSLFEINESIEEGIGKNIFIGKAFKKGENISIGHNTVIGDNVMIDDNTVIYPNVTIYNDIKIGKNCVIHSGVIIRSNVEIGNNVVIENNACIGNTGFNRGFGKGKLELTLPLTGKIIIKDNIFIGANSIIARNDLSDTIIGSGSKIDALVYISRGVKIGRYCRIAGQAAIGDEVEIGDEVSIGPKSGLYDKIKVGHNAFIVSKSGVLKNVKEGNKVVGSPATSVEDWKRREIFLRKVIKKWVKVKKWLDEL